MLTAFLWRWIFPPIRIDRDLFLAFGANDHFFPFRTDNYRAWGFRTPFLAMEDWRRTMTRTVPRTVFQAGYDLVVGRNKVMWAWRGCPLRPKGRSMACSHPMPVMPDVEPAFIIRDVFILVKNVLVLRNEYPSRSRHDDSLLSDRRGRFHDDRSRTRFNDRANQIHDVRGKLDAVARPRRFMMVTGESCRSEDYRCGERSADNEGLVDGLLSRVSYW